MVKVSHYQHSATIICPKCGLEAEAVPIQLQGHCSLICPGCGFHFYVTPKVNGIAQVVEGERVQLADQRVNSGDGFRNIKSRYSA